MARKSKVEYSPLFPGVVVMKLSTQEQKARKLLIRVAQGKHVTQRVGYISYKDVWSHVSDEPWGQNKSKDVVSFITRISGFELANGRPPLNEIVVRTNKTEPVQPWSEIKRYLRSEFQVKAPYISHLDAQEACWRYWMSHDAENNALAEDGDDELGAEEGYKQDRTVKFRSRNAWLIARRKKLDDYTCQVCNFRLEVNGRFVIDCHHTNPLSLFDEVKVTRIEHLVCLCPTCHRIAHTRRYPLSVKEIKALVSRKGIRVRRTRFQ